MENKETKLLGQVRNIKINLSEPMKISIDSMDMRQVTLLVGQNGSGKTMINKFIFFGSMCTFLDLAYKNNPEVAKAFSVIPDIEDFNKIAQYFFKHTFSYPEELSGELVVYFENGTFSCNMDKGEISKIFTSYDKGVNEGICPKYMSTVTRLFTSVEAILAMDKVMPVDGVLEHYKLYDLMHCYHLKQFATTISILSDDLIELLKDHYELDVVKLTYDDKSCKFFYTNSENETRPVSALGAGHQSILNMMIGARY